MNKKLAMGCGVGCLGLILFIGVVGYLFVPKMLSWGAQQLADESERQEIADAWIPPDNASRENFFPKSADGYQLESDDDQASIPDFQFNQEGWHANYQSNESEVDVFVYQVTQSEKDQMYSQVDQVFENHSGGMKSKTSMGYRMYFSTNAHGKNHFWWTKGWLFVFRTTDSQDCEPFIKAFLNASSAKKEQGDAGSHSGESEQLESEANQ